MADTPRSFALSPELHGYRVEHGTPPDAVLDPGFIDADEAGYPVYWRRS